MKTLSADGLGAIISRSIDAMATGKKTTAGYRTIVLVAIGALLGNVVDVKGSLAPLAKLPTMIQAIESQGNEIKELRRLRDEDHKSIEEIRAILKRAGLVIGWFLDLNEYASKNKDYEETFTSAWNSNFCLGCDCCQSASTDSTDHPRTSATSGVAQ